MSEALPENPTLEWLEANATRVPGCIDDDDEFHDFFTYELSDGRKYQRTISRFKKVNPFEGVDRGLVDCGPEHGALPESTLHKTCGKDEHENATSYWVECRLKPEDEKPIHRSVHVQMKRGLVLGATQAVLGAPAEPPAPAVI